MFVVVEAVVVVVVVLWCWGGGGVCGGGDLGSGFGGFGGVRYEDKTLKNDVKIGKKFEVWVFDSKFW